MRISNNISLVLIVFLACMYPVGASAKQTIATVAGTVELVEVQKRNDRKAIPAVNKITLNRQVIKKFSGNSPAIKEIIKSPNSTLVLFSYGTYGNHCSAEQYFAIGFNKNGKSKVFENDDFTLCRIQDFKSKPNSQGAQWEWRISADEKSYLIYVAESNRFIFDIFRDFKQLGEQDLDDIYRLYGNLCSFDEYAPKDFQNFELSPKGYFFDTYMFYKNIVEDTSFKALCYETVSDKDKQLLAKPAFVEQFKQP